MAEEAVASELDRLAAEFDPRSHAFARLGALIATDAAPPSYMSAVEGAERAGISRAEIVGTLIAVLPVVGEARIVSAAPNLGLALGYDVAEALEAVDKPLAPRLVDSSDGAPQSPRVDSDVGTVGRWLPASPLPCLREECCPRVCPPVQAKKEAPGRAGVSQPTPALAG